MERTLIAKMLGQFDALAQEIPGEDVEYWYARDLQEPLGYSKWERFCGVVARAKIACDNAEVPVPDHFVDVNKMVPLGSGAQREIKDVHDGEKAR